MDKITFELVGIMFVNNVKRVSSYCECSGDKVVAEAQARKYLADHGYKIIKNDVKEGKKRFFVINDYSEINNKEDLVKAIDILVLMPENEFMAHPRRV